MNVCDQQIIPATLGEKLQELVSAPVSRELVSLVTETPIEPDHNVSGIKNEDRQDTEQTKSRNFDPEAQGTHREATVEKIVEKGESPSDLQPEGPPPVSKGERAPSTARRLRRPSSGSSSGSGSGGRRGDRPSSKSERPSSGQKLRNGRASPSQERPSSVVRKTEERSSSAQSNAEGRPSSAVRKTEHRPPSANGKADDRPLSASEKTDRRLSSTSIETGERPSSASIQTGERPSSASIQTGERASSASIKTGDRPSSASIKTGERPSSASIKTGERPSSASIQTGERPSSASIQTGERPLPASIQTRERPPSASIKPDERPSSAEDENKPFSLPSENEERPSGAQNASIPSQGEERSTSPLSKAEEAPSSPKTKSENRPASGQSSEDRTDTVRQSDEKLRSTAIIKNEVEETVLDKEEGKVFPERDDPAEGPSVPEKEGESLELLVNQPSVGQLETGLSGQDEQPGETPPSDQKETKESNSKLSEETVTQSRPNDIITAQITKDIPGSNQASEDQTDRGSKTPSEQSNDMTQPEQKEEGVKRKGIKGEAVVQNVLNLMATLKGMETYDNDEAHAAMKNIGRAYWNYRIHRTSVSAALVKDGFAGLVVKMLVFFNKTGIFKNDDVWFPTYYTLNTAWNYSDNSKELAKDLADQGMVSLMIANITHKPYLDNMTSKNVGYVIKSSLSILQNMSKVPELKPIFLEHNAVEALSPFTDSTNDFFKAVSMMVLTTLIEEKDNALLEDKGVIPFMVVCIKKALLNTKNRRHRGFTPTELVECLFRMAANDNNKMKIVDEGALPLLVRMLNYSDPEENYAAAQCLWTLAFDPKVAKLISEEPGCVDALEIHKTSEVNKVRHAVKGTLWKLNDEGVKKEIQNEKAGEDVAKEDHIMISYHHDNQEVIIKLAERLKGDGYRVWLDVERMGGSTLEAMASAVENAAVILVAMSEKYKISPNCRTEAEYTFQLKKDIVPLMMQRRYRPDGWLGMLVGAKFYINFDGKYSFDKAFGMLENELNGRGRDAQPDKITPIVPVVSQPANTATKGGPFTETPVTSSNASAQSFTAWDKQQVQEWLQQHQLETCKGAFQEIDGRLLSSLLTLRHEAPEYFFSSLERKFGLTIVEVLRLVEAMASLSR